MADSQLPRHSFAEGDGQLTLTVELPALDSLADVELDVGKEEVQLRLPGHGTSRLQLPAKLVCSGRLGEAEAKFSRKRRQLTLSWPLQAANDLAESKAHVTAKAPAAPIPASPSAPASAAKPEVASGTAPAYGSIWNKNSWHWEEKNCLDLARVEVRKALENPAGLKHVRELGGSSIVLRDVEVKGDASFALRKGKRLLCYELSASFTWEGRDEFGGLLGVKGTGKVSGMTPDDGEEPEVEVEVSASSGGGPEAKAAGKWMRGQGVRAVAEALGADVLRPAIVAAEVSQADPEADRARRLVEEARAAEAARSAAAAQQQRIAAEHNSREAEGRAQRKSTAEGDVSGSVWNVNAWHWEEKPMTEWSKTWLTAQLKGLSGLRLLSGLAEAELSNVQISGDASVSVRKGKPIVLFLLRIECKWEATPTADGIGEARGSLILPEFSSEDGANGSLIQVEVAKDESRGRLGSAFRKEGVAAVRDVLSRFEEALKSQLQQSS